MPWLVVVTATGDERRPLGAQTTIGRHPDNDIQILDRLASKHHCRIVSRDGRFALFDLSSLNGTLVNDARVLREVVLSDGDRVRIGNTTAVFHERLPEASPIVARPAPRAVVTPAPAVRPGAVVPPAALVPPLPSGPTAVEEPTALHGRAFHAEATHDNGQLVVARTGDVRLRLWNVDLAQGGFVLTIPLGAERPPSGRLEHYVGKGSGDELVFDEDGPEVEGLVSRALAACASKGELEQVRQLNVLVYDALGGRLGSEGIEACRAMCSAYAGRPLPIGELLRVRAGVCRHRAFLFFHLARRLGLSVSLYRGSVPGGRHAWNEVRVGGRRIFADPSLGVVLEDAASAEKAYGYAASRFDIGSPFGARGESHVVVAGAEGGASAEIDLPIFRHELRKVPGDEEAVLLLYPDRDLPDVRYLHVHFVVGPEAIGMFRLDPFVSARVFAIVGDEAHRTMDAVDEDALARLRAAWGAQAAKGGP
jgi:adenylate cyclase